MNKKLNQAIKTGQLTELQSLVDKLPAKQRKEIEQKARYLQVAIAVRDLRKQLKLSQEELAKKINSKREYISRVESGRQNVTLETLHQIAAATNKAVFFQFK